MGGDLQVTFPKEFPLSKSSNVQDETLSSLLTGSTNYSSTPYYSVNFFSILNSSPSSLNTSATILPSERETAYNWGQRMRGGALDNLVSFSDFEGKLNLPTAFAFSN